MRIDLDQEGRKGRYLSAGLKLFAEHGYNLVTVRDIAKEAGTSEAALYRHFKSKEEMTLYLFELILKHYTHDIGEIARDKTRTTIERLCDMQRYTYAFYHDDPESVQFALLSQYQFWDQVEDELKPHFWMREVIEEGLASGEIVPKSLYLLISLYTGLILEPLIQYAYFKDEHPDWELFTEGVAESIVRLLKNHEFK
ncbi:MAG: TetR/AcrR family transcriptional regulator [Xanthomonadaceae bacterium]|nr:TetR/AcrR family transcriptional regulator [Xanthomonadaceae bacterium]